MAKDKQISIDLHDLYSFLITNNRYGYTRNNHLQPSCAFDEAKRNIELMYKVDKDLTMHTVNQLCEECISELHSNFYEGEDDEFENRKKYIEFIQWCLLYLRERWERIPYNIDLFYINLSRDDEKRYVVVDNDTDELLVDEKHALSANEIIDYLFKLCNEQKTLLYNKIRKVDEVTRHVNFNYKLRAEDNTIFKDITIYHKDSYLKWSEQ